MSRWPRLGAACLLLLALIHAVPLAGVVGAETLREGYGLGPLDPPSVLLLRHRAVLFGLLAAGLLWALWRSALRVPMLLGSALSDASFLLLAWPLSALPAALHPVVIADLLALPLAGLAAWATRPARLREA